MPCGASLKVGSHRTARAVLKPRRVKAKPCGRAARGLDPNTTDGLPTKRQPLRKEGCPRAGAQPECASTQNFPFHREPVFFIPRQALDAYSKNALTYDGCTSGAIIYTYVGGNPVSFVDPTGEFGVPGAIAGGLLGGISGGFGAAATGGNVVRGAFFGALGGAIVGGSGAWISGVAATATLRTGAALAGNALGQAQNIGDPNFTGPNVGSFVGAGIGGALGACIAPGAHGTQFAGSLVSQILQRSLAGLPAGSVSGVSNIIGTSIGSQRGP